MKIVYLGYTGRGNVFLRHCGTLEFLSLSAALKSVASTVHLVLCGDADPSTLTHNHTMHQAEWNAHQTLRFWVARSN